MSTTGSKSTAPKSDKWEVLALAARWSLGGLFIYMGFNKALHPEVFLKLVRQYELVASPLLLNSIAAALPWFEVFCGLLLLLGVAVRGTALVLVGMLIPFTLIVLKRALAIAGAKGLALCAVKFDCGCGTGEVYICRKVVENTCLILSALWLVSGRGQSWSLLFGMFKPRPNKAPEADDLAKQNSVA